MNDNNLFGSRAVSGGQDPDFATHPARDRFAARQRGDQERWNLLAAHMLADLPPEQRGYALHVARSDQDARMDFVPTMIPPVQHPHRHRGPRRPA